MRIYKNHYIKKRNGGLREIEVPIDSLKKIQSALNKTLFSKFKMSDAAMAYVKNKSIVTNAKAHLEAKVLVKFDIKDFFPSIGFGLIKHQLKFFGYGEGVATYLSYLVTNSRLKLPQGAPTSPSISNMIFIPIDKRIIGFCKNKGFSYTRYADDIFISSKNYLHNKDITLIKMVIIEILNQYGFTINEEKYGVYTNKGNINVTGITVNKKLSVKNKVREVENAIRYINKYGVENHLKRINNIKSNYIGHIYGLISFIKMVDFVKGNELFIKFDEAITNEYR